MTGNPYKSTDSLNFITVQIISILKYGNHKVRNRDVDLQLSQSNTLPKCAIFT